MGKLNGTFFPVMENFLRFRITGRWNSTITIDKDRVHSQLPRTIKEILSDKQNVAIANGWVKSVRRQRTVTFIRLNDGSMLEDLQVVVPTDAVNNWSERTHSELIFHSITAGCSLQVLGKLVPSQGTEQAVEMQAGEIKVLGECSGRVNLICKCGFELSDLSDSKEGANFGPFEGAYTFARPHKSLCLNNAN